ncbi:MAG: hypothetical protein HUU30_11170 [Burkholderiaceae bacterium]|nr:hypothetical protein [Burkholderiaceae bacterium]
MCALTGTAGAVLSMQAHEFLVDQYRITASLWVGIVSAVFFAASALLAFGRRSGLLVALMGALTMPLLLVLGLRQIGDMSLRDALLQATCAPGFALCFNHAAVVVRLCIVVLVGCIVLVAIQRLASRPGA